MTNNPIPFWSVSSPIADMEYVSGLRMMNPPRLEVIDAVVDAKGAQEFEMSNAPDTATGLKRPFPLELIKEPMRLIITDPTFSADFIWHGGRFVSKELRNVIDESPTTIQFIPVDTSGSSANIRSREYFWMSALAYRSVVDLELSDLDVVTKDLFGRPSAPRLTAVRQVVFKADAYSDAGLFHDTLDQRLFATDELAERVLASGMTGIAFYDVTVPAGSEPVTKQPNSTAT